MTDSDVNQIMTALGELKAEVKGLRRDDDGATKRLDAHANKINKLESIAYVALGIAIASGIPQIAALVP